LDKARRFLPPPAQSETPADGKIASKGISKHWMLNGLPLQIGLVGWSQNN